MCYMMRMMIHIGNGSLCFIIFASCLLATASSQGNIKPQRKPVIKHTKTEYIQMFHHGLHKYVRIKNRKIDAKTKNNTDPYTFLQIDRYGPQFLTIRSYPSKEYVCFNDNGIVEIKTVGNIAGSKSCLFKSKSISKYQAYSSELNKQWHLGFHFRNKKKSGKVRKGTNTSAKRIASHFLVVKIRPTRKKT